jgi:beta-galactosidase
MKLGVCYYPEHWPPERWPVDARLMREAGLDLVRLGEFAWQQMEPAEAEFDWAWLDSAIEVLTAEGLKLVLCTPTATPPAWLCHAHPDVLPVDAQGRRRRFGSRRHYCPNSPAYHAHTDRIVAALAERYGQHPDVLGWQIDNEFGGHGTARCYCDYCAAAFRRWLQARHGSLQALNAAWGTAFWSQAYSDWEQVQPPNLTVAEANPSHVLDYWRFSSDSVVAYQQRQIDQLRSSIAPDQFITTNFMGTMPDLDYHALARPLDLVTWDSYPTGYAEKQALSLYWPGEARPVFAYDVGDPYVTGFCHDLTRGLKQAPFWVMEQQPGHINWGLINPPVRPGAVRLWTWHALASGAEAVVYFRWRSGLFAQEQYHSGLLRHDASPDIGLEDVHAMRPERSLMAQLAQAPLAVEIAMLLDYDNLWALDLQPHRQGYGYLRHLFVYYRALVGHGMAVDIVPAGADLGRYRLVLAPGAFLGRPELAQALAAFAQRGGTVLLGVRSGFKTLSNIVTDQPLPGVYRELVGATVDAWHGLPDGLGYSVESYIPRVGGQATIWAEALAPAGARALAHFRTGPLAGSAALTEHAYGAGRVLYHGFYPNLEQAEALSVTLARQAGVQPVAEIEHGLIALRRGDQAVLLNFTDRTLAARVGGRPTLVEPRDVRLVGA